jgi:hypothetical protein
MLYEVNQLMVALHCSSDSVRSSQFESVSA